MNKRTTLDDIAQAAGVSKQTVSRALNNKGEIDPETKERILKLAADLRYRPNHLARAFHTQQTRLIGFLVPDIANPFFAEVARGLQDAAIALDYHVIICNTDENPQTEIAMMEHLASQGIDGMITSTTRAPITQILQFADSFKPIVVINRRIEHPNICAVMSKNRDGARFAVEKFMQEKRTAPGMLAPSNLIGKESARARGFIETLAEHNHPIEPSRLSRGQPTLNGGYQAAKNLFAVHPETDAIFTYNDLMALGAIRACHEAKRRIPQDISIIGFDDIQLASVSFPALSTIRIDKHAMGQKAFEQVLEAIQHPNERPPEITLEVEFVARETTLAD
jgi:LacI family transcriptional regulator